MTVTYKIITGLTVFGLLLPGSGAAKTETFSGSGRSVAYETTMSLGNGDTAFTAHSRGVAAISTEPPTLLTMRCAAMGLLEAETAAYRADFYCTLESDDGDVLILKGVDRGDRGEGEVIGGVGKWQGATGTVEFESVSSGENTSVVTFQLEVTTP